MGSTELSAETRSRILETAWEKVRQDGVEAASVKDIAAAAGVSRQLVYFHYGNRAGLLLAMARHRDRRSGFGRRVVATRDLAPVEGFEALTRGWCEYVPELLPVARALEAAVISGDEGGEAWTDRMNELHAVFRQALARVADERRLAPGWTVDSAADWAWARLQPSAWDYLVTMRGWKPNEWIERTIRSLREELITPDRPHRSRSSRRRSPSHKPA